MTDYKYKCGTCAYFERDGERRRGWCHARPYDEMVTRDEDHPYMVVTMGTKCCRWRGPHHDNIRTNPVGLARLTRDGLYGWVVC